MYQFCLLTLPRRCGTSHRCPEVLGKKNKLKKCVGENNIKLELTIYTPALLSLMCRPNVPSEFLHNLDRRDTSTDIFLTEWTGPAILFTLLNVVFAVTFGK